MKLLRSLRAPLAVVLAMLMAFFAFGCSAQEISDNLELAGEIVDLVGELSEAGDLQISDILQTEDETVSEDYFEWTEDEPESGYEETDAPDKEAAIDRDGYYYSKDDVALYIHTYGELPENFITKSEAEELGWEGGSVERYLEGAAIGGDKFGNREGLLPKKSGRVYYECDIDTNGRSSRGAKRIVFSNDGLIYYTDDHYESFTMLYGED